MSLTGQWRFSHPQKVSLTGQWQCLQKVGMVPLSNCHWPVNDITLMDIPLWELMDKCHWLLSQWHLSINQVSKSVIDHGQWHKKMSLTESILSLQTIQLWFLQQKVCTQSQNCTLCNICYSAPPRNQALFTLYNRNINHFWTELKDGYNWHKLY